MLENIVRNWRKRESRMEKVNCWAWAEASQAADFFENLQKNGDTYYTTEFGTTIERKAVGFLTNNEWWINEDFYITTTLDLHYFQANSVALSYFNDFLMETWENKYGA